MAELNFLFGGGSYNTQTQTVTEQQMIIKNGYGASMSTWVVHKVINNGRGYMYELIDTLTAKFHRVEIIRPLSKIHGIGHYYDDTQVEFMADDEFLKLLERATKLKTETEEKERAEKEEVKRVKAIGEEILRQTMPKSAVAVIIAAERQDDSDRMTDYYSYSTVKKVILGFSDHKRNIFSEMRKSAENYEPTRYLAEPNVEYENRENYAGGDGYYLGESRYRGWVIYKETFGTQERAIENYAYIAGLNGIVCTSTPKPAGKATLTDEPQSTEIYIVSYSEKAIAVYGNTRPIKETLMQMGGKFNRKLTINDQVCAGWIFPKRAEGILRSVLNL